MIQFFQISSSTLISVPKKIKAFMTKWIDDCCDIWVRGLENFINILDNTRNQKCYFKLGTGNKNQHSYLKYHGKIIRLIVLISLSTLQVI